MRAIIILIGALVTSGLGQNYRSSQDAAILSDARYLAGDGTFGAAYTQDDGVQFKEESDANGDRKGSYSYVDPTGHRRTVFYTAGKNGFQATGDGIPKPRPVVAPKPEYEPLARYNPPDYRPPPPPPSPSQEPSQYRIDQAQSHYAQESTYEPQHYQTPRPRYRPPPPQYRPPPSQYRPPPPQYRPPPSQYRPPPPQYRPESADPRYRPTLDYSSESDYDRQLEYQPARHQPPPPPSRYNEPTTFAPRRVHPPGKLDFNRTPDGFSYTFSKT